MKSLQWTEKNGSTGEGDGIDSNGWLVINGGKVVASGNMLDHIAGGEQTYAVFSFAEKQNDTYTLKNADGKVVGEYAVANAFTNLIVAGDEFVPGEYTFWQGNTQLTASAMENMPGGMFQGERPQMPNGEMPEGEWPDMPDGKGPKGESPELPEGELPEGEWPEMPNGKGPKGERPQMPNGEMPEGERPELPNGMMPPDRMDGAMPMSGETSTIFTIKKGGNQFVYVSPVESE